MGLRRVGLVVVGMCALAVLLWVTASNSNASDGVVSTTAIPAESTAAIEIAKKLYHERQAAERVEKAIVKELRDLGVEVVVVYKNLKELNEFLQRLKVNTQLRDLIKLANKNGVKVCVTLLGTGSVVGEGILWIDIKATDERIIRFLNEGK